MRVLVGNDVHGGHGHLAQGFQVLVACHVELVDHQAGGLATTLGGGLAHVGGHQLEGLAHHGAVLFLYGDGYVLVDVSRGLARVQRERGDDDEQGVKAMWYLHFNCKVGFM